MPAVKLTYALLTGDIPGFSLNFTGALSQMVTVPHSASMDFTGDWTLESWIIPGVSQANSACIISRIYPINVPYKLQLANNQLTVGFYDGTGWHELAQIGVLAAGTLYHVVGIHRSDALEIYINGVLNNSGSGFPTITPTSSTD
jgi:hypothetical protein